MCQRELQYNYIGDDGHSYHRHEIDELKYLILLWLNVTYVSKWKEDNLIEEVFAGELFFELLCLRLFMLHLDFGAFNFQFFYADDIFGGFQLGDEFQLRRYVNRIRSGCCTCCSIDQRINSKCL